MRDQLLPCLLLCGLLCLGCTPVRAPFVGNAEVELVPDPDWVEPEVDDDDATADDDDAADDDDSSADDDDAAPNDDDSSSDDDDSASERVAPSDREAGPR